jgi:hypothetical protein
MTVTVYRSSDASAPVLNGVAGALNAVIHACLVTGYGAKSAAGWAREFGPTSDVSVYRAASGNRFRLRVDDSLTTEARLVGYEVMTNATGPGTNAFPTAAQVSGGLFCRKSNTADAVARPWVLIASEVAFYFFPDSGGTDWLTTPTAANISGQFFFGDIVSFVGSDAYGTVILGQSTTGTSNCNLGAKYGAQNTFTAQNGCYLARVYAGTGTSAPAATISSNDPSSNTLSGFGTYGPYPDLITGGMLLAQRLVVEATGTGSGMLTRGRLPGLWAPLHAAPANHADVMQGAGDLSAYEFLLVATAAGATNVGRLLIETSNTW